MKKFRTATWGEYIKEVEIERENDNWVWINGKRFAKRSTYESYHDTYEQARGYLVAKQQEEVEHRQRALDYAVKELKKRQEL